VKDLINAPAQKYEMIYNTISSNNNINNNREPEFKHPEIRMEDKPNIKSMKNELKSFLKNKLNDSKRADSLENTTPIDTLVSLDSMNTLSYSAY